MFDVLDISIQTVEEIIDQAIVVDNKAFTFYVDGQLAEVITSYVSGYYDIKDAEFDGEFIKNTSYIVTSLPGAAEDEDYQLFVEKVFNQEGKMLTHENDGYAFIFTHELSVEEIKKNIRVEEIVLCNLVDAEDEDVDYIEDFIFD